MSKCPKIRMCGTDAAAVEITGNPRNQEPSHVRIRFPGGEVEVARASDGPGADYWVHVHVNRPEDCKAEEDLTPGHLTDARLDIEGKHTSDADVGDFEDPGLYHLAVRVTR